MSAVISDNPGDNQGSFGAGREIGVPASRNPNDRLEQRRSRTPIIADESLAPKQHPAQLSIPPAPTTAQRRDQPPPVQGVPPSLRAPAPSPIKKGKKIRDALTIASLNMKGGRSASTQDKWPNIYQFMRTGKIGVLVVQETHLTQSRVDDLHRQFPDRIHIINCQDPTNPSGRGGIAVILNKQLTNWREIKTTPIQDGRALLLELPWRGSSRLHILAVYAPNNPSDNKTFWDNIREKWLNENLPQVDILLGDLNLVEERIDRLPITSSDSRQAIASLQSIKDLFSLTDGWRQSHPDSINFTYKQDHIHSSSQSRSRIDRIYVSPIVFENSHNWAINETPIKTDHKMISVSITDPGSPHIGKGRWAIPPYLTKDRKLTKMLKDWGLEAQELLSTITPETRSDSLNPQTVLATFKHDSTFHSP